MDVLPDRGRVSKSILPRKTGLFKIAQCKVLGRTSLLRLYKVCQTRHNRGPPEPRDEDVNKADEKKGRPRATPVLSIRTVA